MSEQEKTTKIDVPKYIKILSIIYIVISIIAGFCSMTASILEQGHITGKHIQYVISVLENVITGFVFWGIGQVFAKFMKKNK